ncbi:MAG TPA: GTP-binding protein [Burkholderiales bacterium]|nr:GTP-binding protein [Burkholderiales bacterium]
MSLLGEIEKLGAPAALGAVGKLGERGVLRFITAGSVDDGKSTLIGRLLHDAHAIMEDQFSAVERASVKRGALEPDLSLLTDGLEAEREQGITIDVAYRYFATPRRKFIIADTPGHEQYTRNMVTGASTADAAIILLDAAKGVLAQSKRHLLIAHLLGIRNIIVAVNKMDSVDYDQRIFDSVKAAFSGFAAPLAIKGLHFIPVCALRGDMIVDRGDRLGWYAGATVLEHLEAIEPEFAAVTLPLRLPVQLVNRGGPARGYAGRIAAGKVMIGDELAVLPSGRRTRIRAIFAPDGERALAVAGESVVLTLADELDIARGDMLVGTAGAPRAVTTITATLCWLSEDPLRTDVRYVLRHTTRKVKAKILQVNNCLDIHTLEKRVPNGALQMNDIADVTLALQQPVFADAYDVVRTTGAFILIDPATNRTVAAGMIK